MGLEFHNNIRDTRKHLHLKTEFETLQTIPEKLS